jgi:hypothetical protein
MAVYLVAEYITGVAIECRMFTVIALIEDWLIMVYFTHGGNYTT